jgi:hypothetical protein
MLRIIKSNAMIITFPRNEWNAIKERFDNRKSVSTIRVDNEYGKFKTNDVLETEWGVSVIVSSVTQIKGGIKELENRYEYFAELTEEMKQELSNYDKMEIIVLRTE